MKKIALSVCLLQLMAVAAMAGPFTHFKDISSSSELKPFAADLGGLIGANDFSSGRSIGFPGFDVGVDVAVQAKPSADNRILRNAKVNAFGLPMAHVGVALPLVDADLVARGVSYSGFSILGGGLRVQVLKSGTVTKFIPDVSVSAYYDVIDFKYFKGTHMSMDAAASFDIPFIKPYIGVGLDKTKVEVKNVSAALNGKSGTISKPRYTLGVRFSPVPLLYVYGAYNILHGQTGYSLGAGLKF